MKIFLLLLFFMTSILTSAQNSKLPKNSKTGEKYIYCYNSEVDSDERPKWIKILYNPSVKTVKKIQMQLKYLGYNIVETGIVDYQTKRELLIFNKENGIGNYKQLLYDSEKLIKELYKEKRKSKKRHS